MNASFFSGGGPRNILIAVIVFVCALVFLTKLSDFQQEIETVDYSTFVERVKQEQVAAVDIQGQEVYGKLVDGTRFETIVPANDQSLWPLLNEHKVKTNVASTGGQWGSFYLFMLMTLVIGGLIFWYFMRQSRNAANSGGGAGGIFSIGKSRAKMFMPSSIKENFESVAGADGAKEELKDVIDFLKFPEKYTRLGAKITRGILLVGEPGNGKTLLARAVAGEANVPFFSISGSDFIEVFVGVGASRVRDLFAQARKQAPCIVFIDEIDAVGRQRGVGSGGGQDEREQTLNQLLTEMDGFEVQEEPIIIIAATNRPDVLDKALLRPGRFDRQVNVPFPDRASREAILKVHAKGVKLDESVDLAKLSRGTPGFSGADLANLINEAAIIASKRNADAVTMMDFDEARDKIILGKEHKTLKQTEENLRLTAFHEAGHTLVNILLPDAHIDPLYKVTIMPRGRALGVTHKLPIDDKVSKTQAELEAEIKMLFGGRIAEEIIFGNVTTGASNDFEKATQIVRHMVCHYGMDKEIGPVVYAQGYDQFEYSQKTAEQIDAAVRRIVEACYKDVTELLNNNREKLEKLANALVEKETLYGVEVYELLGMTPREDLRLVS